jgi:hypothetical protein
MKREQAITIITSHAADLRKLGVSHLFLFGSVARDEANPTSDVDIFFDYDNPAFSLFDAMAVQEKLGDILNTSADVMSRGSLHPRLRADIETSAVQVF